MTRGEEKHQLKLKVPIYVATQSQFESRESMTLRPSDLSCHNRARHPRDNSSAERIATTSNLLPTFPPLA